MAEEPDNVVQALLRQIRATQLEQSANLDALQARSQRIEKQLQELYARLEQMKLGATYDDLFSELERILANEKPK
jgi:capsule polysaccharide export protein KpsE/RkpR